VITQRCGTSCPMIPLVRVCLGFVWQVSGFQSTPVGTGPGAPATSDDMAQSTYFAAVGLTLSSVRGCVCVQSYLGTSTLITQKWSCLVGALLASTYPRTPEFL
jgi:hypothetical protein